MSTEDYKAECPGRSEMTEEAARQFVEICRKRVPAFLYAWQCRRGCWHVGGAA